ncbi:MAG: DUF4440 domain-containing protein [Burkholderiales bacterium]|nr:DUF4440 domain-containing protein [Burkholderiales bacterium]
MKRLLNFVFVAAAAIGFLPAPAPAAEQGAVAQPRDAAAFAAFKQAIRAQYDLKEKAWAAGDYEGLVKGFYAPTAFTASEGDADEFIIGRARFLEIYKTYVADVTRVRIESVHTYVHGDMGWDWTNFYADVKPEKQKDYPPSPVRILFTWEKIDGRWMCTGDVVLLGRFKK